MSHSLTSTSSIRFLPAVLAITLTAAASPVHAAVTAHFSEIGGTQVHVTWSGSFDTTGLIISDTGGPPPLDSVLQNTLFHLDTSVAFVDGDNPASAGTPTFPIMVGHSLSESPSLPGTDSPVFGFDSAFLYLPAGTIPEPSRALLLLAGLAGTTLLHRRRRTKTNQP